ncbi:aminoglycoside phosphotransferase [Asanoa ishikariensis]|uniref:Predicted kinase, aminoglycoside phosphotransferase (APT) family n=1 Tax=Asanoa ishikariensis TaxID=137265 RepID=A0A1H3S513_9ACTN|nr:aminoglycoside phosphotransferase family protein [Asanoa ishikariensis]GIF66464.1 aminoglycoside phosphotransferase [Asanoa ishikariensis]SDZ33173.1 Predicted kinase, aminoglycoside phosphotransferase (APT) family [Asanoa ishikariensis]
MIIDVALVRRLVAEQFPQWAGLPVSPVAVGGNDNRTFHLGDEMSVRLPSAEGYVASVEKEQRWLPVLAPHLPVPIPAPLAQGRPGAGYPWPWSVNQWLDGTTAGPDTVTDQTEFAVDLAGFLTALQAVDTGGEPAAGRHSFWRGAGLAHYDDETRKAIAALDGRIDAAAATVEWDAALDAQWRAKPVWFHGDVAAGNILVRDGRLAAVIDFGTCGVGDPACDLVIAWTFFGGPAREAFRKALNVDDATWQRGRGWALWKALITIEHHPDSARQIDLILGATRLR